MSSRYIFLYIEVPIQGGGVSEWVGDFTQCRCQEKEKAGLMSRPASSRCSTPLTVLSGESPAALFTCETFKSPSETLTSTVIRRISMNTVCSIIRGVIYTLRYFFTLFNVPVSNVFFFFLSFTNDECVVYLSHIGKSVRYHLYAQSLPAGLQAPSTTITPRWAPPSLSSRLFRPRSRPAPPAPWRWRIYTAWAQACGAAPDAGRWTERSCFGDSGFKNGGKNAILKPHHKRTITARVLKSLTLHSATKMNTGMQISGAMRSKAPTMEPTLPSW